MNKIAIPLLLTGLVITALFCTSSAKKQVTPVMTVAKADEKGFALLELFTSQGCSSCPPADELLGQYALLNDKHIISLAFHVDYWNRLGWIDSFSNNKFSKRQREYASFFNTESVYTPQLVVNGKTAMVGSESEKIKLAISKAINDQPLVQISIEKTAVNSNTVTVNYTAEGIIKNDFIHAVLVQKKVNTKIKAGENRGVDLANYNVVRDLVTADAANSGNFLLHLPKGITAPECTVILFTQDKDAGTITGASQAAF